MTDITLKQKIACKWLNIFTIYRDFIKSWRSYWSMEQ